MKKQLICLALLSLIANLQAGPKKNRADQLRQPSTGSALPVDEQALQDQLPEEASPMRPAGPPSSASTQSGQISPRNSPVEHSQASFQRFIDPSINDSAAAPAPRREDGQDSFEEEEEDSGMLLITKENIASLEIAAINSQTASQKVVSQIYQITSLAQSLTERALCSELKRILNLRKRGELSEALNSFEADSDKGAFLAKGLDQAIVSKSIDKITEMLEVMHHYELKEFVPTSHQDQAARMLLAHNNTITTKILPVTLRTTNPGDLSPRSRGNLEMLKYIHSTYRQAINSEGAENHSESFALACLKELRGSENQS